MKKIFGEDSITLQEFFLSNSSQKYCFYQDVVTDHSLDYGYVMIPQGTCESMNRKITGLFLYLSVLAYFCVENKQFPSLYIGFTEEIFEMNWLIIPQSNVDSQKFV